MKTPWIILVVGLLSATPANAQMGMATGFLFGYIVGSAPLPDNHPATRAGIPPRCLAAWDEAEYGKCRRESLAQELIKGPNCSWKDIFEETPKDYCRFKFNLDLEIRWLKSLEKPAP